MTAFLALTLVLAAPASPIPGVPFPPGGEIDPVFTQVFTDRAAAETRSAIARLDADTSRSTAEKAELKKRLGKLKTAGLATAKAGEEHGAGQGGRDPPGAFQLRRTHPRGRPQGWHQERRDPGGRGGSCESGGPERAVRAVESRG